MKTTSLLFAICCLAISALAADESLVEESKSQVFRIYPDSRDKESPLFQAMAVEMKRLKKENPSAFDDSKWPMKVAAICAAELGIAPNAGDKPRPEPKQALQSFEISELLPPQEMGRLMEKSVDRELREQKQELAVMEKVEALGYYATSNSNADVNYPLANGSGSLRFASGKSLPFLGFSNGFARLFFEGTWISVPRKSVDIVQSSEHPQVRNSYEAILADFNAYKAALANRTNLADLQKYEQQNQRFKREASAMEAENLRLQHEANVMRQQRFMEENRRQWEDMRRKSEEFMNR